MSIKHALDQLTESRPLNRDMLWRWIWVTLGYRVAYRPVCEGHTSPFEFIYDAVNHQFTAGANHGSRGSGKTLNLAIVHLINSHFDPGFRTAHVGAVLRQASLNYNYLRGFLRKEVFEKDLAKSPLMSEVVWKSGSYLQILPGTIGATSGPHPNRSVMDEFDLIAWDVYQNFLGMAQSSDLYPAQTIYTSAMVTSYGPMARLIEEAGGRGMKLYRNCVFDVMEPCATCEDAERVKRGVKLDPPACPLWNDCHGRARNATGHMKLADVINKYMLTDEDTWAVQYLCTRGSRKGLMYANWSPDSNVTTEAEYKPELPVVWLCDDGYSPDPLVVLAANEMPNGDLHIFDELYCTETLYGKALEWVHGTDSDPAGAKIDTWPWRVVNWDGVETRETHEVRQYKRPSALYISARDSRMAAEFRRLQVPIRMPSKVGVVDGCGEVRRMICDHNGHRGVLVHPRCRETIRQIEQYHRREAGKGSGVYTEDPADNTGRTNPDDGPDSIRVLASWRIQARQQRLAPPLSRQSQGDP